MFGWDGRFRMVRGLAMALMTLAACSSGASPATTPVVASTTTSVAVSSTDASTTSTVDPVAARRAEIEAIIADVEFRYFDALKLRDEGAIQQAFSSRGYYESAISGLTDDIYDYVSTLEHPLITVDLILADTGTCVSAQVTQAFDSSDAGSSTFFAVYEVRMDGQWGLSFVGSGYSCNGPHPFGDDKL